MRKLLYPLIIILISACADPSTVNGIPIEETDKGGNTSGDPNAYVQGQGSQDYFSAEDEYQYINILRNSAGMAPLQKDDQLSQAAKNHVQYLLANDVFGHGETLGLPSYTGSNPAQRAIAAGYHTLRVSEGISNGRDVYDGIDKLMSAIYHRFSLLNVEDDRIGMYYQPKDNSSGILVHDMSNSGVNQACTIAASNVSYYQGWCSPDIHVSAKQVNDALSAVAQSNPAMIVWPPENGVDIPPVFFEETPDPLPDYSVSGYPISVQFNPAKVKSVSVSDLRLFDLLQNSYVPLTRLMEESSDPNEVFSAFDFSLFPLKRLEWGREYRVELEYVEDGVQKTYQWTFRTRILNGALTRVDSGTDAISINNQVTNYIYLVPANGTDVITHFNSQFPQSMKLKVDFEDQNTLIVDANGKSGDVINITLNNFRTLKLTIK